MNEQQLHAQNAVPGDPAKEERPISRVYPVIDNDLARDNLENDLPAADLEDLQDSGSPVARPPARNEKK